jgi:hypothetical protein
MCEPATVITALSIASTVSGYVGQHQQAQAQADHQGRLAQARADQMRQNNINVMNAYRLNLEQVQTRQQQENQASSQQAQAYQRENLSRQGLAQAATGESGAAGLSRDLLMAEFDRTQAGYLSSLELQSDYRNQSVFFETQAMQLQAEGRAQSIQPYIPTPVNGPSLFGAAVGIGSGVMQGYDAHLRYTLQGHANPDPNKMNEAPGFGGFIRQGLGIDPTPGFS